MPVFAWGGQPPANGELWWLYPIIIYFCAINCRMVNQALKQRKPWWRNLVDAWRKLLTRHNQVWNPKWRPLTSPLFVLFSSSANDDVDRSMVVHWLVVDVQTLIFFFHDFCNLSCSIPYGLLLHPRYWSIACLHCIILQTHSGLYFTLFVTIFSLLLHAVQCFSLFFVVYCAINIE